MYIGIDLGTSGVKAVLMDDDQALLGEASSQHIEVQRPRRSWSEQNPDRWWEEVSGTLDRLAAAHPKEMGAVTGIGLSGQMYSATVLDETDTPLRPAMLWSDTRSSEECRILEEREPALLDYVGRRPTPFTTAPKLIWLERHEPDVFKRIRTVLLPKDYVRLQLTGEKVSDIADSSGTFWVDIAQRSWSDRLLEICKLDQRQMPRLVEGTEVSGHIRPALLKRWGMTGTVVVAGGGGDNQCGACGSGIIQPGSGTVSLGTSAVLFVAMDRAGRCEDYAIETMCHSVPGVWHAMAVILSAASCLNWLAKLLKRPAADLVKDLGDQPRSASPLLFLPFFDGCWSPMEDTDVRGAFVGLNHGTDDAALTHAVLQGVAFALAGAAVAFKESGATFDELLGIGGGSRSMVWLSLVADSLGVPLAIPDSSALGAAFGAARLGMIAATGASPRAVLTRPRTVMRIEPDPSRGAAYGDAFAQWQALYKPALAASAGLKHLSA